MLGFIVQSLRNWMAEPPLPPPPTSPTTDECAQSRQPQMEVILNSSSMPNATPRGTKRPARIESPPSPTAGFVGLRRRIDAVEPAAAANAGTQPEVQQTTPHNLFESAVFQPRPSAATGFHNLEEDEVDYEVTTDEDEE
ncbi:hypothetical protein HDU67_004966, partial [Dinochytrium kinnereticum]